MPVFIISFIIFLMIAGIISALIISTQREKRTRLMQVVKGNAYQSQGKAPKNLKEQRKADLSKKLNNVEDETKKKKERTTIKEKIVQAGMEISV